VAYPIFMIASCVNELGEHDRAAAISGKRWPSQKLLGDPRWHAYVLLNLGLTAQAQGSHDEARCYLEQP